MFSNHFQSFPCVLLEFQIDTLLKQNVWNEYHAFLSLLGPYTHTHTNTPDRNNCFLLTFLWVIPYPQQTVLSIQLLSATTSFNYVFCLRQKSHSLLLFTNVEEKLLLSSLTLDEKKNLAFKIIVREFIHPTHHTHT